MKWHHIQLKHVKLFLPVLLQRKQSHVLTMWLWPVFILMPEMNNRYSSVNLNFHPLTYLLSIHVRFNPAAQTRPCLLRRGRKHQNRQESVEKCQRFWWIILLNYRSVWSHSTRITAEVNDVKLLEWLREWLAAVFGSVCPCRDPITRVHFVCVRLDQTCTNTESWQLRYIF